MVALYKEEIESVLRTPGLAGFQMLALTDWPRGAPTMDPPKPPRPPRMEVPPRTAAATDGST